ncbi:MAG: type II secretion system F family protein [Lachnospiraceae bacterium]|nr:type II secretion system F family protein [Lachnospiraceae bacterium]
MQEWIRILPWLGAGSMWVLLFLFSYEYRQLSAGEYRVLRAYRELAGWVRKRQQYQSWYARVGASLKENGAEFHYGQWVAPTSYLALRILLSVTGALVVGRIGVGYGILCGVLLYGLPQWLLWYLNEQDNRRMLPDIRMVYHALEIQLRAGVYMTDALAECYGAVTQRRLRRALLDLAGDIVMKADVMQAMERFQGSFRNRYIDALCITLIQALESGQAVELLQDIGEQVKDMERSLLQRQKSVLERSITFYQLGILAAVLGIALYAVLGQLLNQNILTI